MDCVNALATMGGPTVVVGFVTFLLGLIGGHKFSLMRDRRKEFNEAARPVREPIEAEQASPSPRRVLGGRDFNHFMQVLGWWKRRRFERAREAYEEEKDRATTYNELREPILAPLTEAQKKHLQSMLDVCRHKR